MNINLLLKEMMDMVTIGRKSILKIKQIFMRSFIKLQVLLGDIPSRKKRYNLYEKVQGKIRVKLVM